MNVLKPKINKSVAMIGNYKQTEYYNTPFKVSKVKSNKSQAYTETLHLDNIFFNVIKFLLTNNCSLMIMLMAITLYIL